MDEDLFPYAELSEEDVVALSHQVFLQELTYLLERLKKLTKDKKTLLVVKEIEELCEKFR